MSTLRRTTLWLIATALPFPLLLAVGHSGARVNPAVAVAAVIAIVAFVQSLAMPEIRRRWFVRTIIGLTAALAAAAVVLAMADAFGAERGGIAVGHMVGGAILVLVQAGALEASERRTWIAIGVAAWIVFPIVLVLSRWHPAGDISPFAGYRELATFTCLLVGYGAVTALHPRFHPR